jgi:drug/metabolite transporter (DMT)-like permease
MQDTNNKIIPSISLLLAGFGYALYGPLSRIVGNEFGPIGQTLSRSLIRLIMIIVIIFLFKIKLKKIAKKDIYWFTLLAASAAFCTLFYIPAIIHLPFGLTMFLFYALGTISSYFAGYILFKEKLNTSKIVALILAVIGLAVMFVESVHLVNNLYLIFACASGFFYGLYSPFSKKLTNSYSLTQSIFITIIAEFFIYLVSWFVFRDNIFVVSVKPWLANLLYAFDVMIITYLVFYGFRHLEAQIGSLLILSELIFIILIGLIFYNEVPTTMQLVGGALIIFGMVVPQFAKK